jgi:hypothetical protein
MVMVMLMVLVYFRAVVMSLPRDELFQIVNDELNILIIKASLPPNLYKSSHFSYNPQLFPSIFNKKISAERNFGVIFEGMIYVIYVIYVAKAGDHARSQNVNFAPR